MAQPAGQPSSPAPANNVAGSNVTALNSETKNGTVAPKPAANNSSVSQKSAALPGAKISSDKLNNMAAVDNANLHSSASAEPLVRIDSEPPPAARPKPILKPVSGGVLNGTAISLPAPMYPDAARRFRISGMVTVEVIVDETGKVISAQATSGPAVLREVAAQAALRARFSPTKLSGQPVKVAGLINYKFSFAQ